MRLQPRAVLAALISLGVAATVPHGAGAASPDALTQVKEKKTLVVGIREDYAPYGYLKAGRHVGIEPDLVHHIARDLFGKGGTVTFVPVTAKNRFQILQSGKVDVLMATVSITPERKEIVSFSPAYAQTGWTLLVRKDASITGIADLKHKNVGVVAHTTSDSGISALAPEANKVAFSDGTQAESALKLGTVDAFAENSSMVTAIANAHPEFKVVGDTYQPTGLAAACPKEDSSVCDYIGTEIAKYERTGQLRSMYRGWVGLKDMDKYYPAPAMAAK